MNARSLEVEEERDARSTPRTRAAGRPFFPSAAGQALSTLEIPTTLPTLDETLAWPQLESDAAQRELFRDAVGAPGATHVHTIHAEVEGRSKAPLFEAILDDWQKAGASFVRIGDLAEEVRARRGEIPTREIVRTKVPGRGGTVATGWPGTS